MRELDRLKVIQAVVDGELQAARAAERLLMSTRQVRRLTQRYRHDGPVGLISGRRNRPGNRRLEADLENRVVQILRESYSDFGPTLVAWYQRLRPYDVADTAKFAGSWQAKLFAAAAWFQANVAPANPDYRVVAGTAGALSFNLFDHVVNIDGLANDSAGEAILANYSWAQYTQRIKPDYLIELCKAESHFGNLERLHVVQ